MKLLCLLPCLLYGLLSASAQSIEGYQPLDTNDPVIFKGDHIEYRGATIVLGPNAFFIDGQLTNEIAAKFPYVFNSINEAAKHLKNGSETSRMTLFIAPYVYWIDDPDDPAIRVPENGNSAPYGMVIACEWLRFQGLNQHAANVVIAANRGQTIGAKGNFTLFRFIGEGTSSENITFGNYCNVDLVYPLKPSLNREKRASAIVQAQLIHCNGDKIVARNTRFISRLNLCPFVGGKRVLFDRCHFESTDDALCATGIYLNSTLDFYSSKPFYWTRETGAVFLNCDIHAFTSGQQYFTKANGQLAVIDTRIDGKAVSYLGWNDDLPAQTRNYQYNVTLNNQPILIGKNDPANTVQLEDLPALDAYSFRYKGNTVYNTYNLLAGNDDWDPMGIKQTVIQAEKDLGKRLTHIPTQLLISPNKAAIETKKNTVLLKADIHRFGNYESAMEKIKWSIAPAFNNLVALKASVDGSSCEVTSINTSDDTKDVIVTASTASGLEAATVITVSPEKLAPPAFSALPSIHRHNKSTLKVDYTLDMRFEDQSLVSWYRCTDASGSNAIEVAVSRMNEPLLYYPLSAADIGYYIMAKVAPKHTRCDAGQPVSAVWPSQISTSDISPIQQAIHTDFKNISISNQEQFIPGFWTWSHLKADTSRFKKPDAWYYGEGADGAANMTGLLQTGRSASMLYTPVKDEYGDMKIELTIAPYKTAGQGFSVANLYMDVLIKFDGRQMNGYALRFIRTTKFHDAVDCYFVKYQNGRVSSISKPISISCYRTPCHIYVEAKGNKLIAHVDSSSPDGKVERPGVLTELAMETTIPTNKNGGFGIQYYGGAPAMINELNVSWVK